MPDLDTLPEFRQIDVDDLVFDAGNPRLPKSVNGKDRIAVLRFMLDDADLIDLMRSIASQGFFPGEPILVCRVPGGTYMVVEGNRRLAATILLVEPSLAPIAKPSVAAAAALVNGKNVRDIPCLIFPSYESILAHLGYRHVTGVKEWEPLAKARYLAMSFKKTSGSLKERFRDVARTIGSKSDYVGRLLTALKIYERWESNGYFGMTDVTEDTVQFSLLSSALSYENVQKYLGLTSSYDLEMNGLEEDNLRFVLKFMFEPDANGLTRLLESRNLGTFARVLGKEEARSTLLQGSTLEEASELLGEDEALFSGAISRANALISFAIARLSKVVPVQADLDSIQAIESDIAELRARSVERFALDPR